MVTHNKPPAQYALKPDTLIVTTVDDDGDGITAMLIATDANAEVANYLALTDAQVMDLYRQLHAIRSDRIDVAIAATEAALGTLERDRQTARDTAVNAEITNGIQYLAGGTA